MPPKKPTKLTTLEAPKETEKKQEPKKPETKASESTTTLEKELIPEKITPKEPSVSLEKEKPVDPANVGKKEEGPIFVEKTTGGTKRRPSDSTTIEPQAKKTKPAEGIIYF